MTGPVTDLLRDIEVDIEKSKSKKLRKAIIRIIVLASVMAVLQMVFLKFGHPFYSRAAFYPTAIMVLLVQFFAFPLVSCVLALCIKLIQQRGRIDSEKVFKFGSSILIVFYFSEIPYWIFVIFKYIF
ncbi:hypothetical protein [Agriterribacter sp.]|uniref:hypothetical protein n=1 Tax=Agriterribacter sp. TaxID=2821509 RepID=UPI002B856167|nr:hypothetical protein [Agriterribacter sp.]HRO46348.1 hypothetical protein [Agriterribacter sp.]